MIYKVSGVEIELTSRCNASCPQCSRNYYGGETWPTLPLVDLSFDLIKTKLGKLIKNLSHVKLCGTYGDPCVHPKLIEIVQWIVDNSDCEITINTNGSLRTKKWWNTLAKTLGSRGRVFFGIDGLEDTHHLYRIDTSYNKIIENLKTFNQAGGRSVWSFLIFEHNQHQVDQARTLSELYGCENFAIKSTSRFLNKTHEIVDKVEVKNKQGQTIYWLKPTTKQEYINSGYKDFEVIINKFGSYRNYLNTTEINCRSMEDEHIDISSEGYVLPCAFLLDRFYGVEAENHPDREKLFRLIEQHGGLDKINLHKTDIDAILNGEIFQQIKLSWTGDRLDRCANQCGSMSTLLANANKELLALWAGNSIDREQK